MVPGLNHWSVSLHAGSQRELVGPRDQRALVTGT